MKVVVALGGNALLRRGEAPSHAAQLERVKVAADSIAEIARDHTVVVTHGNGPQIGWLALQAQACPEAPAYPLDVLGAETEGMIGYLIEQALVSRLPDLEVATLLTQVEVAEDDEAFLHPSKPIGPICDAGTADLHARRSGHAYLREESGWRRVVPSPEPIRILEIRTLRRLVDAGTVVVCAGGGGVPVVRSESGEIRGVEAVVDKDLASAHVAAEIRADALLLLTDVSAVFLDWPEPRRHPLRSVAVDTLDPGRFEAGSMAPKLEAALRFVHSTGGLAAIGALEDAPAVLEGRAGTRVTAA